jgi:hypothetical protein
VRGALTLRANERVFRNLSASGVTRKKFFRPSIDHLDHACYAAVDGREENGGVLTGLGLCRGKKLI